MKRLLPVGTILKNVYLEVTEQNRFTHGRQIGTYPLLLSIPFTTNINVFKDVMVVDYGFRSLSVLPIPLKINQYSKKTLYYLPNFGKKRSEKIYQNKPYSDLSDFKENLDEQSIIDLYEKYLSFEN